MYAKLKPNLERTEALYGFPIAISVSISTLNEFLTQFTCLSCLMWISELLIKKMHHTRNVPNITTRLYKWRSHEE